MIRARRMLMIGSAGRDSGKTQFACSVIRKSCADHNVIGVKVTTIQERGGRCPRGGESCGVCAALDGNFCLTEEAKQGQSRLGRTSGRPSLGTVPVLGGTVPVLTVSAKDTDRLLDAGAAKVYWLRVLKDRLEEGARALLDALDPNALIVCESNSLRTVVEPDLFLMFRHADARTFKASARAVREHADRVATFNGASFDLDLDDLSVANGQWALRHAAAAIVLAGGSSTRMGRDKAMLPLQGRPLIEHVVSGLQRHFKEVIISANDPKEYAFLGERVVGDETPGRGPLMGIVSTLEASTYDVNFVVACDIPHIDFHFVRKMLRKSRHYDGVVPRTRAGNLEPLCAVYRKSGLLAMRAALTAGKRRIVAAFDDCRITHIELANGEWLKNINTMGEYKELLAKEMAATKRGE
ncbi:MAG TPA: molybdenum cofactor guanylyltransferase [Candidatus Hydrogenedentes bacterium]|nr:molybdenum cofactor guanylyltransferase [Candidatus Hydrogenedentota bacterium]